MFSYLLVLLLPADTLRLLSSYNQIFINISAYGLLNRLQNNMANIRLLWRSMNIGLGLAILKNVALFVKKIDLGNSQIAFQSQPTRSNAITILLAHKPMYFMLRFVHFLPL